MVKSTLYKNKVVPPASGTLVTIGSFSPASLAFCRTSCSSAAYAITRSSSLDRATHAPFGTSASSFDTSLTAIMAYLLSRPQKDTHPQILAQFSYQLNIPQTMDLQRLSRTRRSKCHEETPLSTVSYAARIARSLTYTPQPYRSACSSVRCISSRSISVKTDPPIVLVPG